MIAPPANRGGRPGARSTPASLDQVESTRLRLTFLTLLVVSLFVLLFARLWFLQVMAGERYEALAQGNAVRTVTIDAPRGQILDRDGQEIVGNRYANVVSVRLSEIPDERETAVLADLADLLGMTVADIHERIADSRVSPVAPVPIYVDAPPDIVFYIHENASTRYPGVYAEQLPLRDYPHGTLAAHVVGYLGEISSEELESEEYADHSPGDVIGWAGVERVYERSLRGIDGERRLEVNAVGEVVRQVGERLPTPGGNLQLTIDLETQQLAETALAQGIDTARGVRDRESGPGRGGTFAAPAGAAVVLDPDTGEVVAMASNPTFDPGVFTGGIGRTEWEALQAEENHFPLINRAIQSSYPPGSVFKVVSAAAALDNGFADTSQRIDCPGAWEWNGSVYRNWTRRSSGAMNLAEALTKSCDTVFYELARQMWLQEQNSGAEVEFLPDEAEAWGFANRTGIDLPAERAGVIPGRSWKREYWERHRDTYCEQAAAATAANPESYSARLFSELCEEGYKWRGGDAVNMSIGQGDVQTTPLQIANAFAAIANGGTLYRPHVAQTVHHSDGTVTQIAPEVIGTVPVDPSTLEYIEQGLLGVTAPGGTAGAVFGSFDVPIAGKTGTAEMKPKQPFAWFVGYNPTPVDGRRYVVVAMVEEGGGGSQTAAPIVRNIFAGLFGLDQDADLVGEPTD